MDEDVKDIIGDEPKITYRRGRTLGYYAVGVISILVTYTAAFRIQKDIEDFLEMSRNKFIGFTLGHDTDTLVGLPRPIHESVKILKQHKYVSVADIQIKKEEEMEKCPMSLGEEDVEETAAECLYKAMLVNIPQYMIALLKILLAAAPTSKAKTDSINILADILPEEMPVTVLQSMKLGIDVNRHKEIIVKSVSALLLLLLKHFKLNHIYQ
ncbi:unnamed protein product, partial [Ranitomeya imitator]